MHEALKEIQEIVGHCTLWKPQHIRKYFFQRHLNNWERFTLSVFFYVNGLDVETLLTWMLFRGQLRDNAAEQHIRYCYTQMESGNWNNRDYYAYNVSMDHWQFVNGLVKRRVSMVGYHFQVFHNPIQIKMIIYLMGLCMQIKICSSNSVH